MALQPEIWERDIVANLYKGNEFMTRAHNADQYVVGGRAVHIPNAAAASNVTRNRSSLPATVVRRTDTDVIYLLDEFTTDPILIPNIDTIQLSYDKRASVMAEDTAKIKEVQADWLLYNWGANIPAGNIIRTSGAASATVLTGATGNRKLFRKEDLLAAKILMDNQKLPADGRVALLPAEFAGQLLQDKDLVVNFEKYADLANGIIGRLYGFDLMIRPGGAGVFTNATPPVLKTPGAASATDDNAGALCWHPFAVERALGTVKMFEQLNNPQYYGDIYSFLVMLGGRSRRADNAGVIAIVEAASA